MWIVIIGLGWGQPRDWADNYKWDWTGNTDSAIFCFGEANMNSYEENEMRKLGAKVQFCAEFALCAKPAQDNLRK
jgi:hypothetical protein